MLFPGDRDESCLALYGKTRPSSSQYQPRTKLTADLGLSLQSRNISQPGKQSCCSTEGLYCCTSHDCCIPNFHFKWMQTHRNWWFSLFPPVSYYGHADHCRWPCSPTLSLTQGCGKIRELLSAKNKIECQRGDRKWWKPSGRAISILTWPDAIT